MTRPRYSVGVYGSNREETDGVVESSAANEAIFLVMLMEDLLPRAVLMSVLCPPHPDPAG